MARVSASSRVFAPPPRVEPMDAWNGKLLSEVHPEAWPTPTPPDRYHLVVLGGGTGGLVTAAIAAGLGARVALIERHLLGGDCLNTGCVPSKSLLAAARAWRTARGAAAGFGGPAAAGQGDFAAAMARMRRQRAELARADGAARFRQLGVDVYFGHGRFVARDVVEVGGLKLPFGKAVIATGGRPAWPALSGLDELEALTSDTVLTSQTVFSLTELPQRLLVLGGGPMGCELAQAFARFGSEVTLWQSAPRLLPRDDADAGRLLRAALEAEGVRIETGVTPTAVIQNGVLVQASARRGEETFACVADRVLVATGRRPNVEQLGLEAAGIAYGAEGVDADDNLRTSNPRVFALGDVLGGRLFTHLADAQARLVVRNALFKGRKRASALQVPWCTETSPAVAHVGLEPAALARRACDTLTLELAEVDRAVLSGAGEGFVRVHLQPGKDRILAATAVAEDAGELLAPIVLAMSQGIGLRCFSDTIWPYPSRADAWRRLGDTLQRRRLTPRWKSLIGAWLQLLS